MNGLTLATPSTGEHFAFRTSALGPAGAFQFRWTLDAGKTGPGRHHHPHEHERFEVVSGVLRIWVADNEAVDLGPGDVLTVPPGTPHRFLAPGPAPAVVDVRLDGPRMERVLVPMAVHAARGGGMLGVVGHMVLGMEGASHVADPVGRAVTRLFAWLARPFARTLPLPEGWEGGGV